MMRPFLVSALLLLSAPPALRSAEVTVQLSQTATNGKVNLRLTNNDPGAVYNSATLDLGAMLRPVIDAVVAKHPALSSEAEVWAYIGAFLSGGISIQNDEVYLGWSRSLDPATGLLAISNNGLIPEVTYTVWQNTTSNGSQDEMVVTVNLGSLLDLDGSGGLEEGEVAVVLPALSDPAPVPPQACLRARWTHSMNSPPRCREWWCVGRGESAERSPPGWRRRWAVGETWC